mmetsp:Transcript_6000/g.11342  ORF Transcript_6000/g.11342 Transcript_6000/m.11342 type:complete len:238 (-) Transcript_6000:316-1029(-)
MLGLTLWHPTRAEDLRCRCTRPERRRMVRRGGIFSLLSGGLVIHERMRPGVGWISRILMSYASRSGTCSSRCCSCGSSLLMLECRVLGHFFFIEFSLLFPFFLHFGLLLFLLFSPLGNFYLVLFPFFLLAVDVGLTHIFGYLSPLLSKLAGYFSVTHFRILFLDILASRLRKVQKGGHGPFGCRRIFPRTLVGYLPRPRVHGLFGKIPLLVFGSYLVPMKFFFCCEIPPHFSRFFRY